MTRLASSISRVVWLWVAAVVFLIPTTYLHAQKTVPQGPSRDDAADMAMCPKYIMATFYGPVTGSTYNGLLPRGADGIGKVYYSISGIGDTKGLYAAFGQLYVYGFVCRVLGAMNMPFYEIPSSNVEIIERKIQPTNLVCGGGGDPGSGVPADANRVIPIRFDCGNGGTSGGTGGGGSMTVITVTTCEYNAVFNGQGQYMYTELVKCSTEQYIAMT